MNGYKLTEILFNFFVFLVSFLVILWFVIQEAFTGTGLDYSYMVTLLLILLLSLGRLIRYLGDVE